MGGPLSHVEFKKSSCSLSLFKEKVPVDFKKALFHNLDLRNMICCVCDSFPPNLSYVVCLF